MSFDCSIELSNAWGVRSEDGACGYQKESPARFGCMSSGRSNELCACVHMCICVVCVLMCIRVACVGLALKP